MRQCADGRQIPPYQGRGCAWPHGRGVSNLSNSTRLPYLLTTTNNAFENMKVINRKRRPANSGAHGDYPDPSPCECTHDHDWQAQFLRDPQRRGPGRRIV